MAQPSDPGFNVAAAMLPGLTRISFSRLTETQLQDIGAVIKSQLLRPVNNMSWTVICRALQFFRDCPNVPEDLRGNLSREITAVAQTNLAGMTKKQLDLTLHLARGIEHVPQTGMPLAVNALTEPPKAPPKAPTASAAKPPSGLGKRLPATLPKGTTVTLQQLLAASGTSVPTNITEEEPPKATKSAAKPSPVPVSPVASSSSVAAKPSQPVSPTSSSRTVPANIPDVSENYKDHSFSERCQQIANGCSRALLNGEICCLLTGQTMADKFAYSSYIAGRKVRTLQKSNPQIPIAAPTEEETEKCLKACKEFLECMRPVNTYVDHFAHQLKADYEFERSHQLKRLIKNDEWERFRLQNEGMSFFKMKVTYQDGNEMFTKEDGKPLPFAYYIYPGQTVWVSADDAPAVDPDNKNITGTGEVVSIGRESVIVKGLPMPMPPSTNGLYRIDYAVTTVNLDRMAHALGVIQTQNELYLMKTPEFKAHIPITENDQMTRTDHLGIVEPGTLVAQLFFHNIRYSVATAREHYRRQFGATPPPGLPDRYTGFNSYDPPPPPTDSDPFTIKEINFIVREPHPLLRTTRATPLDSTQRPLSRHQHNLNDNQLAAVAKVIDERRQITLVQGPPGTGKTTTAIAIICEWVMRYHCKVLATAHSNKGVDNLLQGLVTSGIKVVRVGRGGPVEGSDLAEYSLETLIERHPLNARREQLQDQLRAAYKNRTAGNTVRDLNNQINAHTKSNIARAILKEAEVVCATCIGVGSPVLQGLQFELVLVDEATQAVEPAVMIPLGKGAKQVVMIGDQAQLPPTCKCPESLMMGLDVSLFDRLIGNGVECHVLEVQYRMHPTISCFPSWRFYRSLLADGVSAWDRMLPAGVFPTPEGRVCFLEVDGMEEQVNTSKINRMEATCVVWMVSQLMNLGNVWLSQIGVITPYAAQVRVISQAVRSAIGENAMVELEVHSVDGFQGREKDFIILSMVRSKPSGDMTFITDWRRTNVALTRARYGVIVVGKALALCQSTIWLDWLKFHKKFLLCWDTYQQCLVPVHPVVLDHINSITSPGEVQYSLDEMLAYKLWQSEETANGRLPNSTGGEKPKPLQFPGPVPSNPYRTANGLGASRARPIEIVDIDDDDDDVQPISAEAAHKRAGGSLGGEPPTKKVHVIDDDTVKL